MLSKACGRIVVIVFYQALTIILFFCNFRELARPLTCVVLLNIFLFTPLIFILSPRLRNYVCIIKLRCLLLALADSVRITSGLAALAYQFEFDTPGLIPYAMFTA